MVAELSPKYPKHLLSIAGKVYELGSNINLKLDIKQTYPVLTFDFPFVTNYPAIEINPGNIEQPVTNIITGEQILISSTNDTTINTSSFQKYDLVKLYFRNYDTQAEAATANIDEMSLIFNGYISDPHITQSGDGYSYQLECRGTMGLAYERSTLTKFFEGSTIPSLVNKAFSETDLGNFVPNVLIDSNIKENFLVDVDSDEFFGNVIDDIRDKYALQIFQKGDGALVIRFPSTLFTESVDIQSLFTTTVTRSNTLFANEYDASTNVYDIDYGNRGNAFDTVIVVGNNVYGIAFDPIAYQLKSGIPVNELQPNITPNKDDLNTHYVYRRDVTDTETCERIARETLLEFAKNFSISFSSQYLPEQQLGSFIRIINSPVINSNQLYVVKNMEISIDTQRVTLTCYTTSLDEFPEDILLEGTGILDVDILAAKIKEQKNYDLD